MWEIFGLQVYPGLFLEPFCIESINETNVVLIPKFDILESIKRFRPIALCNVI